MKSRLVVMASGNGSIAQAIIDAALQQNFPAQIVAVVCDQPEARVLVRATTAKIPTFITPLGADRKHWDDEIFATVESLNPDLVVSAGFMRILSPEFVSHFKVINSHPALLPLFPGAHAVADALAAGVSRTGITVHWVDKGVDTGEVIAQQPVEILPNDDVASLHERIKIVERALIVSTIEKIVLSMRKTDA